MKKLFLLFAIFTLSFGLIACEETNSLDTTPPVFEGLSDILYEIGQPTPDYRLGVTAIDTIDGDLTRWIEINLDDVDLTQPGSYPIVYWVIDDSGNVNEQTRTIIVSAAPVLDLVAPLSDCLLGHRR